MKNSPKLLLPLTVCLCLGLAAFLFTSPKPAQADAAPRAANLPSSLSQRGGLTSGVINREFDQDGATKTLQFLWIGGDMADIYTVIAEDEMLVSTVSLSNGTSPATTDAAYWSVSGSEAEGVTPVHNFIATEFGVEVYNFDPPLRLRADDRVAFSPPDPAPGGVYVSILTLHGTEPPANGMVMR